jgi:hypothetical protein
VPAKAAEEEGAGDHHKSVTKHVSQSYNNKRDSFAWVSFFVVVYRSIDIKILIDIEICMENKSNHIRVKDLEIYKSAKALSNVGWEIYQTMDWQTKKVIGDQFITATDSYGANVVEG